METAASLRDGTEIGLNFDFPDDDDDDDVNSGRITEGKRLGKRQTPVAAMEVIEVGLC